MNNNLVFNLTPQNTLVLMSNTTIYQGSTSYYKLTIVPIQPTADEETLVIYFRRVDGTETSMLPLNRINGQDGKSTYYINLNSDWYFHLAGQLKFRVEARKVVDGQEVVVNSSGLGVISVVPVNTYNAPAPLTPQAVDLINAETTRLDNIKADKTVLNAHIGETTTAHNIPTQIDNKITEHNLADSNSHSDMRGGISLNAENISTNEGNIAGLDTRVENIELTTIPALEDRVEDVENSKITNDERTKLSEINPKAQVNIIESITVNGKPQEIIDKSVTLTEDIKDMIDAEINILLYNNPDLLDTIEEIRISLNNDHNFYDTMTTMINKKLDADFINNETITVSEFDESGIIAINVKVNGVTEVKKISIKTLLKDIYDELSDKVNEQDILDNLPNDLIYGGENLETSDPIVNVYNAERLNSKPESKLNVESAIKDGEGNVIIDTYRKNTDIVDKATKADKILFDGSYVPIVNTSVNYAINSGNSDNANKLNNKTEANLSVAESINANKLNNKEEANLSVANAVTANNANRLNNKLESELSVENSVKLGGKTEDNLSVASSANVTTNINGKAITSIFESDGTTVKEATNSVKLNNKESEYYVNLSEMAYLTQVVNNLIPLGRYDKLEEAYNNSKDNFTLDINGRITSYTEQTPHIMDIVLPVGTKITGGYGVFTNTNYSSLTLPYGLTKIEGHTFATWNSNIYLNIPDTVTEIGNDAFYNWSVQKHQLILPEGLISIGTYSFRGWGNNNKSVIFPKSVVSIGDNAFYGWRLATSFVMTSITPPTIGVDTFSDSNDAPIYVPDDSVTLYKTTGNWTTYTDRIFPISEKESE